MKHLTVAFLLSFAFGLGIQQAQAEEAEVNIYSARHYPADEQLFDLFTKETGIRVNIIQGSAEELMERLRLEGDASPADILITVDAGNLWRAKEAGVFQPVHSAILEKEIPTHLRDPDNQWFAFAKRARIIVYDTTKVKETELSTYEDLANPKWKGHLLIRSSNNIYNQSLLASLIAKDGEAAAQKWAEGIVANMARAPEGGDIDQINAILAGEGDIAISNSYYFARMLNDNNQILKEKLSKLKVFFPNQSGDGTHINISGAGMAKYAPNPDNARKFLEFLISPEAQRIFADANYEYPVNDKVPLSPTLQSFGTFKQDALHVAELGKNNPLAVKIMDRAKWK